jgi:hypothetical protein
MMLSWARCFIAITLLGTTAATGATGAPATADSAASPPRSALTARFGFQGGVVHLTGSGDFAGSASLIAEQLDPAQMSAALESLSDTTLPGEAATTQVSFDISKALELQPGAATRTWIVPLQVKNLPVNSDEPRFAKVGFAGKEAVFSYSLSNRPTTPVEYDLETREEWFVTPHRLATALLVSSRDQPVSGLRIALAKLSEQTLSFPIETQALELCPRADGECTAIEVIPAHSSRTLFLRMSPRWRRNGVFKGTILFAADARPEGKAVPLQICSSSTLARVLGAVLIVVSVLLAWYVNVRGRLVVARLAALKLTMAAHARFGALLHSVQTFEKLTNLALDQLSAEIKERSMALSTPQLDAQSLLPSANEFYKSFDDTALKALLAESEKSLKALSIVVQDGIDVLRARWTLDSTGSEHADIAKAALHLNVRVHDETAAATLVADALALLPTPRGSFTDVVTGRPTLSSAALTAQIESTNRLAWYVYILLVSVAGVAMLIVKAPGFGTSLDFVFCFFWGFGLPTALDKLQQLTPSSVGSALTISIPK